MDILWYHLNRILKIRYHLDHTIPCHLEHPVIGGIKLPKVAGVENSLDTGIGGAQAADDVPGSIGGIIIDKYQFIVILGQLFL